MKFPKAIVPLLATGVLVGVGLNAPPFFDIHTTPNIHEKISYILPATLPQGFVLKNVDAENKSSDLIAQNPTPVQNSAGTCVFTEQVAYLPSYTAGRGDAYLTREYIYDNSRVSTALPTTLEPQRISSTQGIVEALSSSYGVPDAKATKDVTGSSTKGYYRTVAVRAFDKLVSIPEVTAAQSKGQYNSDTSKGIPLLVLTYDCQTKEQFNPSDFRNLLSTVKVDIPL